MSRKIRNPGDPDTESEEARSELLSVPAEVVRDPTLQHPDTVNPKAILSPVLTSQGWICPDPAKKA